jgi:phosphate transport system substrate-binding protein
MTASSFAGCWTIVIHVSCRRGAPALRSARPILVACIAAISWSWLHTGTLAAQETQEKVVIVGSGSYLPFRLYQAWITEFNKSNSNVQLQYLPLGSSESIIQVSHGVGDFGSGEVPLTDAQLHSSKVSLMPIPTALVGIVPIYNLPGNLELNFSGELLGEIYLGAVKNWKDSRIAKLNPDVRLPDLAISVVHRSQGKGSNYIFTDFLSKTSSEFRAKLEASPSPAWPLGVEADRSQDMVKMVASIHGAIGYVELTFADNLQVGRGRVQNSAGHFVRATPASIEAACLATETSSAVNLRADMTNAPGKESYPIASFTWIYMPTRSPSDRRSALQQFLNWSLLNGQSITRSLGYVPLPAHVAAKALAAVNSMQ